MSTEQCFAGLCFFQLGANEPKFFGFSEFLTGSALMVLAWTTADVRYRFRIRVAPIPLQVMTYVVVAFVGGLTLLTDFWRSNQWYVPEGGILTPASWQAILGALYFFAFLTWVWFAFIKPASFGPRNAERFAQELYRVILNGSPAELPIIADELIRSSKMLINYAVDERYLQAFSLANNNSDCAPKISKVNAYASDILLLIADRRFCKSVVESSPLTIMAIFQEIINTGKFGVKIKVFAKNIVNEALINKNSFLYHEAEGYQSGLIGYQKPLSQALFANYQMVESIGSLLDPDLDITFNWSADQLAAYCRAVILTFRDYIGRQSGEHSFVLYRAICNIEHAISDLYKLNGVPGTWDSNEVRRAHIVMDFIKKLVSVFNENRVPEWICLRIREDNKYKPVSFYDHIANLIFEVIFSVSAVQSPSWDCWSLQHNLVWSGIFGFDHLKGKAAEILKFKVRRLIYEEIVRMNEFPNFKGAKILGLILNVLGFKVKKDKYWRDSRALHKVLINWVVRNYAWLHEYNPRVAAACLVDGVTYEVENHRLVKTYPVEGLRREPQYEYLEILALQK